SFSLAVTDDKAVTPSTAGHNIKGSLLLEAGLKGYIESPGYYFAGDRAEALALDNLLLTQGWSRYTADDSTYMYAPERGFEIAGTLVTRSGQAVKGGNVSLLGHSPGGQSGETDTGDDGRFVFTGLDIREGAVLILQGRDKKGSTDVEIILDKPLPVPPLDRLPAGRSTFTIPGAYIERAAYRRRVEDSIWTISIDNIEITAPRDVEAERQRVSSGLFSSVIGKDKLNDFRALSTKLKGSIEVGKLASARPSVRPAEAGDFTNILEVDGVQTDFSDFWNYYEQQPSYMFESIEVLSRMGKTMYGARGAGAGGGDILVVRIKMRGAAEVAALIRETGDMSSVVVHRPEGYQVRKEFYVPPYDRPEAKAGGNPDLRTTIYWNPAIRTDADGLARVEFYTADNATTHSYALEGIGGKRLGFYLSGSPQLTGKSTEH
ncbi:MAG: carboxypeptidase-like regulatory domain-containing protein, partial [Tannerellaceae bacterium]|nr:carboxypeptidase-like regulatory domain-containing protein [Tannerellaceae bacterium]